MAKRIVLSTIAATTLLLHLSGCSPAAKKARFSERAEGYFKSGDYDNAKIEYLNVLRIDQADANAYARMGAMWAGEGVPLRAGAFLVKARDLAPKDLDNRYRLASVLLQVGDRNGAFNEATEILKQAPDNGPALALLVEAAVTPEQSQAAEQEMQKFPQHDKPYFEVANAILALRKKEAGRAEAALNRALSLDPKCWQAHIGLAQIALASKEKTRAEQELKAAADSSAVRSRQRLAYAEFELQTGDKEEVKKYLEGLTREARDFPWGLASSSEARAIPK